MDKYIWDASMLGNVPVIHVIIIRAESNSGGQTVVEWTPVSSWQSDTTYTTLAAQLAVN